MHGSSRLRRTPSFRSETPARLHVVNDDMAIRQRRQNNRPITVLPPVPTCADPGSLLGDWAMHMLRQMLREKRCDPSCSIGLGAIPRLDNCAH